MEPPAQLGARIRPAPSCRARTPAAPRAALQAAANAMAALNQVLAQAPSVEYMQKAMVVS